MMLLATRGRVAPGLKVLYVVMQGSAVTTLEEEEAGSLLSMGCFLPLTSALAYAVDDLYLCGSMVGAECCMLRAREVILCRDLVPDRK